jgi:transposase InsO family protein
MRKQYLVARPKRRWTRTTDSSHGEPVAPNLLQRDFKAEAPDRVWVTDTTYLPVVAGFIYLVVILDLFSRKAVGWAVGDHHDADLSCEALRRALAKRHPPPGLIVHSDRGAEFAAKSFRALLDEAGAFQSMSRKGDCWDNAVAESFFSTMEFEMEPSAGLRSAQDAEPELFDFIEGYYNARRLHSTNGYRSPNRAEADWRFLALAA